MLQDVSLAFSIDALRFVSSLLESCLWPLHMCTTPSRHHSIEAALRTFQLKIVSYANNNVKIKKMFIAVTQLGNKSPTLQACMHAAVYIQQNKHA